MQTPKKLLNQASRIIADVTGHMPGDCEYLGEQEYPRRGIKFIGGTDAVQVQRVGGLRASFTRLEPGTDRIHIRLDHDTRREFWAELSFSLGELREWMEAEGFHMQWQQQQEQDIDIVM